MQRFRGGLVFKAHRLVYHSTLGLRVIKKKKRLRDASQHGRQLREAAAEREGNKLKAFQDFCLKMAQAKAGVWPWLSIFVPNLLDSEKSKSALQARGAVGAGAGRGPHSDPPHPLRNRVSHFFVPRIGHLGLKLHTSGPILHKVKQLI